MPDLTVSTADAPPDPEGAASPDPSRTVTKKVVRRTGDKEARRKALRQRRDGPELRVEVGDAYIREIGDQ